MGAAFDRKKELEADHIGIIYMARAGYDPEEGIKVLERLEEETGQEAAAQSSFLATHPSNPDRIAQLRSLMPEAEKARELSQLKPPPPTVIK
jgi:predicted Zn-dependent protease